ncbi:hypothetical protein HanXRQr2_Chr10g0439311 [Helianthus annuus]|uniref:Uncharacterized protein n=1 Tax=Helianthus annuus TaxID=4232 RepID=A0A9K3N3T5_HELAN|nr:hypothetical protein HanXRQr2_Chr10g0439311 [Helianthus annuus]KAJ0883656.1 hypothetical protein HanPSC8_Chr10g0424161 [Helianthus annuus]
MDRIPGPVCFFTNAEVLGGARSGVRVKLHDDAAGRSSADGHVEEDLRVCHWRLLFGVDDPHSVCLLEREG